MAPGGEQDPPPTREERGGQMTEERYPVPGLPSQLAMSGPMSHCSILIPNEIPMSPRISLIS
jgi:hypothetical protein